MKQKKIQHLSSNMEDYLEAILSLKKDKSVARVRDISKLMKVKAPSVTAALRFLSDNGFIIHERYGYVDMTSKGKNLAEHVQNTHTTIRKFIVEILGVDREIADEDACKIEHNVSPQTLKKIAKFIEFVRTCPEGKFPLWLKNFEYYDNTGKHRTCNKKGKS